MNGSKGPGAGATAMPRAILAEDEPLLAAALERMLRKAWPQLVVERVVHDGGAALEAIASLRPDIAFLDIRMPVLGGLDVAGELARSAPPRPEIVFVTAYEQYAIDAFEAAAVDYLLKPVGEERLARCVERLRSRLAAGHAEPGPAYPDLPALLAQLQDGLRANGPVRPGMRFLRASIGDVTRQIPVGEVLYFEARDKYVSIVTRETTALIRMPLSELLAGLDPEQFAQIHRSTIVRLDAIDTIRRDLAGRLWVHLHERLAGREVRLPVSRQFAARFRGM